MATQEELSIFGGPGTGISEADKRKAEFSKFQEELAKQQAEMENEVSKTTQINDNQAMTDVIKQTVAPEPTPAAAATDGFEKPKKEKLIETQDLLPLILGAVMGGVMGGPGGALMGAAGGLYKGQSDRRKTTLDRLKEANDVTANQSQIEFRDRQLAAQQARDAKTDNYRTTMAGIADKRASNTGTSGIKDYEYYVQGQTQKGVPADQILSFEDFSSGMTPAMTKIMEGLVAPKPAATPPQKYNDLNDLLNP